MMTLKRWSAWGVVGILGVVAVGCSSSDSSSSTSSSNTPNAGTTGSVSKALKASEGGTVAMEGDVASVSIPPGALASDTTITINVSDKTPKVESKIYDFGPNGTKFTKPVDMALKFDGTVPEGKSAALSWLDEKENKWVTVEGSKLEAGKVVGKVSHFTKFAIVFVDGKIVAKSECGGMVSSFRACGGDMKGNWTFANVCMADMVLGANPYAQVCPDAQFSVDVSFNQTVTVDATTIRVAPGSQTLGSTLTLPKACFAKMGPGASSMTCDSFSQAMKMPCTDKGDACSCSKSEVNNDDGSVETYTVSGNTFTSKKDGKPEKAKEYCVSGDTLTVKELNDKGQAIVYMLKRKP